MRYHRSREICVAERKEEEIRKGKEGEEKREKKRGVMEQLSGDN